MKELSYLDEVACGKVNAPMYVKKQLAQWQSIVEGKDSKYKISEKKYRLVCQLLKLIRMPKGKRKGKTAYQALAGFQWVLLIATLCTVYREDEGKRRYETVVLEIARKNGKTFLVALIFILLLLTEPKFSKLYSVAPDGTISREIKSQIEEIIQSSPALCGSAKGKAKFKILLNYIHCNLTENRYTPLNTSRNRMDSREPAAFVADEVGALPTIYPIEAMYSGQTNVKNPLGVLISTKYETTINPWEEQVERAKKILDGSVYDESVFSLLFEPDEKSGWETNDSILQQANPLAITVSEVWEDLLKKRQRAVELPSARANFLTKHCNIIYQGMETETYLPVDEVRACEVEEIDWHGKEVFVALDLALSRDNCSVAMVSGDVEGEIEGEVIAFFPEGRMEEKTRVEKVDYYSHVKEGEAVACGDMVVDYGAIERYILALEKEKGCTVIAVGYDPWNAISTANKLEEKGMETVEIKQHSSILHRPTKLLEEKVLDRKIRLKKSRLLEINFENARCTYDTNMNRYVNKKKSNGKIDMVVALINAICLLQSMGESTENWGAIEL